MLILAVVLLVFRSRRLPRIGPDPRAALRGFRESFTPDDEVAEVPASASAHIATGQGGAPPGIGAARSGVGSASPDCGHPRPHESPTGRNQIALVPDGQMAAIGERAFAELLRTQPLVEDPDILAYVGCVARALVEVLPEDSGRWQVAVFDDPTPNAFALPGGRIGVNLGMLQVARSPDQLAAVIGHEIAHVLADHSNERLTQELAVEGGLMLVRTLGG